MGMLFFQTFSIFIDVEFSHFFPIVLNALSRELFFIDGGKFIQQTNPTSIFNVHPMKMMLNELDCDRNWNFVTIEIEKYPQGPHFSFHHKIKWWSFFSWIDWEFKNPGKFSMGNFLRWWYWSILIKHKFKWLD